MSETLLLDRSTIAELMPPSDYVDVVEEAFRTLATGTTLGPSGVHVDAPDGEFHIKVGGYLEPEPRFAVKANAGFFENRSRFGLPNIQGAILLVHAGNGRLLAVLDSKEITKRRTGAATAVAARALARRDANRLALLGCGVQGAAQLEALAGLFSLGEIRVWSRNFETACSFAREVRSRLGLPVEAVEEPERAVAESDLCVTCTPARAPILRDEWIGAGTFVAAVGADSPEKQEVDPLLLARARVVVDILEQCASVGELHHAVKRGALDLSEVHGTLGDVLTGRVAGRTDAGEVFLFDSTGTALQDAASAAAVYRRAVERGMGTRVDLGA